MIGTTAAAPPGIALAGKEVVHDKPTAEAGSVTAAEGLGVTEAVRVVEAGIDDVGDGLLEAAATEGDGDAEATAMSTLLGSIVFGNEFAVNVFDSPIAKMIQADELVGICARPLTPLLKLRVHVIVVVPPACVQDPVVVDPVVGTIVPNERPLMLYSRIVLAPGLHIIAFDLEPEKEGIVPSALTPTAIHASLLRVA